MLYDILIVGGGPAGLTAAVYARRAGKTALVLEKDAFGGQIANSPAVENIPGFEHVTGTEFADRLTGQALAQGAVLESADVVSLTRDGDGCFTARSAEGEEYRARAAVLAAGTKHRTLGLPGEEAFIGNGIFVKTFRSAFTPAGFLRRCFFIIYSSLLHPDLCPGS